MIHIGGKWYIGGDPYNITLYEKKIAKKGKTAGKERYEDVAYYSTIEQLLDGLVRRKVRISTSEAESLNQLSSDIREIHNFISEFCEQYKNELKQTEIKRRK